MARTELITPAGALAGLLDIQARPMRDSDPLPPLWHGIPTLPSRGQLRMFAGGRATAYAPLRFGQVATRTTRVIRTLQAAASRTSRESSLRATAGEDGLSRDGCGPGRVVPILGAYL